MATQFKIRYRDGRTQRVEADNHGVHGDFIVFSREHKDILRIAKNDVESVAHADVPEPEGAPIGIA